MLLHVEGESGIVLIQLNNTLPSMIVAGFWNKYE
jgi:hypothetical protein